MLASQPKPETRIQYRQFLADLGICKGPRFYLMDAFKKNGCLSASVGVILLSGFSAKQRSSRSTKWLRSLVSASFMPPDAAVRRVRRSRVGFTMGMVLTFVYNKQKLATRPLAKIEYQESMWLGVVGSWYVCALWRIADLGGTS